MKDDIEVDLLLDVVNIFFENYLVSRPGKILQGLKAWKRILSFHNFWRITKQALFLKTDCIQKDDLKNWFWMYVQKKL